MNHITVYRVPEYFRVPSGVLSKNNLKNIKSWNTLVVLYKYYVEKTYPKNTPKHEIIHFVEFVEMCKKNCVEIMLFECTGCGYHFEKKHIENNKCPMCRNDKSVSYDYYDYNHETDWIEKFHICN